MRRLLPLLTGLLAAAANTLAAVLVGVGDDWRYVNAPALEADAAWTDPGFADGSWRSGPSGFGISNYGERTHFNSLPGDWRTVLFRRRIVLPDTNGLGTLVLRIDHRDGFVAYLNGREIARRGLGGTAGEPVPFDAVPTARWPGSAENIRIGAAAEFLVPGTNVLAIQVHSDSDFERPVLVPELLSDIIRGPYLQASGPNAMTVLWRTAEAWPGRIRFGREGQPPTTVDLPPGATQSFTIEDLEPGAPYQYSVSALLPGDIESRPETNVFRALPAGGPLEIAVIGDSGAGTAAQFAIARRMRESGVDLVLHAGDVIYPSLTEGLTDTRCLSVYRRQMATTPFAFAWGNHDLYSGTGPMLSMIRPPTNPEPAEVHLAEGTTPRSYYSFDAGDVHIAVVFQSILSQYAFRTNTAQYRWLDADLAATTKPWKIIIAHHPIATSGGHRFTDYNGNGLPDWQEFAGVLVPLANKHGVQLYLSGHDHVFERFLPLQGLHPIVTGGGGTHLYSLRGWDSGSSQLFITHHFTRIHADRDTLRVQAIATDGRTLDTFQVQRTAPGPGPHPAAWTTPVVETRPADNGDGNLVQQTFDLRPAPGIPAVTGRTANLGIAHVALDKTHLHLGLEAVLIPSDADICLFLEVPGLAGVESLAGLGNGIADPAGEGVDAIDAFENIRFTGFRPAVAAVLGDEYADGTSRGFQRPGQVVGLGQGVFHLAPGLPSVAATRIQQFNRSPQDTFVTPEQGADFIEVSIPRAALGNVPAGSIVRLAAVAASNPDFSGQRRPLDTGFVGTSLEIAPDGTATLAAVEVRLPADPDPDDDGLTETEEIVAGTNPANPDTDGDGLRDGWEWVNGLDPLSAEGADGPDGDPDGDGFGNRVEQELGTNPRAASEPSLRLQTSRQADGSLVLRWAVPLGGTALERAPAPEGPWTTVEGFPRHPGTIRDHVEFIPDPEPAFFRLRKP